MAGLKRATFCLDSFSFVRLPVMFNPATVVRTCSMQSKARESADSANEKQPQPMAQGTISYSFELQYDSSMLDRQDLLPGQTQGGIRDFASTLVSSGFKAVSKFASKKTKDFKDVRAATVCGVIECLMTPNPLDGKPMLVTFSWGTFKVTGFITNVTTTYSMFTAQGVPTRAKQSIQMTQSSSFSETLSTLSKALLGGAFNEIQVDVPIRAIGQAAQNFIK